MVLYGICAHCCFVWSILAQDEDLFWACGGYGTLEEAQSAIKKGANPDWRDSVSVKLVHSQHDVCVCGFQSIII